MSNNYSVYFIIAISALFAKVNCSDVPDSCASDVLSCFKTDLILIVDRFAKKYTNITIFPGLSLTTDAMDNFEDLQVIGRNLENTSSTLDTVIMKQASNFLRGHSIDLNLWNVTKTVTEAVTARGKNKKGDGGGGMILIAGGMISMLLGALSLGGIALIAGKALLIGVIAFMISSIIGMKSLSSQKHGGASAPVTYW
ncbi:unnamed protein product [Ceutorhynchus assimilis]|uniref:Uncharacterized protein n=1 Tax=Ceutorhynchus assimilis TaxID=467358 RepID=A0A9N9Q946_9CUCU|nr:unnamed protein product [Ceutorhynchus assimilis]